MKNLPTIKATNLPTLDISYGAFDIIGNTLGRYFDYKRDTAMIEYETEKVHAQTKIVLKKIDTELTKSLDENEKNYKKEMKRLKMIAKVLKKGRIDKNKIIEAMTVCTDPELLREYRRVLSEEHHHTLATLNLMSSYDTNTKMIEGV